MWIQSTTSQFPQIHTFCFNTFHDIAMAPRFFGSVELVGLRSLAQREDSSTTLQQTELVIMFENHVGSERPPFSSSVAPAQKCSESAALSRQRNSAALEEITSATSGGQPNSGATSELWAMMKDTGTKWRPGIPRSFQKQWRCHRIAAAERSAKRVEHAYQCVCREQACVCATQCGSECLHACLHDIEVHALPTETQCKHYMTRVWTSISM